MEQGSGPGWTAEYARQSDYANNPASYRVNYWLLEPSWTGRGLTAKLGWEHLGSDGRHALQTPLATLHAFNGWDDQFLVTHAGIRGLLKLADYRADGFGHDDTKLWLQFEWHGRQAL